MFLGDRGLEEVRKWQEGWIVSFSYTGHATGPLVGVYLWWAWQFLDMTAVLPPAILEWIQLEFTQLQCLSQAQAQEKTSDWPRWLTPGPIWAPQLASQWEVGLLPRELIKMGSEVKQPPHPQRSAPEDKHIYHGDPCRIEWALPIKRKWHEASGHPVCTCRNVALQTSDSESWEVCD